MIVEIRDFFLSEMYDIYGCGGYYFLVWGFIIERESYYINIYLFIDDI